MKKTFNIIGLLFVLILFSSSFAYSNDGVRNPEQTKNELSIWDRFLSNIGLQSTYGESRLCSVYPIPNNGYVCGEENNACTHPSNSIIYTVNCASSPHNLAQGTAVVDFYKVKCRGLANEYWQPLTEKDSIAIYNGGIGSTICNGVSVPNKMGYECYGNCIPLGTCNVGQRICTPGLNPTSYKECLSGQSGQGYWSNAINCLSNQGCLSNGQCGSCQPLWNCGTCANDKINCWDSHSCGTAQYPNNCVASGTSGNSCNIVCDSPEPEIQQQEPGLGQQGTATQLGMTQEQLLYATENDLQKSACDSTSECIQGDCIDSSFIQTQSFVTNFICTSINALSLGLCNWVNFALPGQEAAAETIIENLDNVLVSEGKDGYCIINFDPNFAPNVQVVPGGAVTLSECKEPLKRTDLDSSNFMPTEQEVSNSLCTMNSDCCELNNYKVNCMREDEFESKFDIDVTQSLWTTIGDWFTTGNHGVCVATEEDYTECPEWIRNLGENLSISSNPCSSGYIVIFALGIIALVFIGMVVGRKQ